MNQSFNINAAKTFYRKKKETKQQILLNKFKIATNDFETIINMIISKYDPDRIIQWGSLLDKTKFSEISDIDIALEGITSAENFFKLLADAEQLTEFPLDIVQLEHIHPLHKEMIINNGKVIYQKNEY